MHHDAFDAPGVRCDQCNIRPTATAGTKLAIVRERHRFRRCEPVYTPGVKIAARQPQHGEPLWEVSKNFVRYSCELRNFTPWGFDVRVFRNGELSYRAGRWNTREAALSWADEMRVFIENGSE